MMILLGKVYLLKIANCYSRIEPTASLGSANCFFGASETNLLEASSGPLEQAISLLGSERIVNAFMSRKKAFHNHPIYSGSAQYDEPVIFLW